MTNKSLKLSNKHNTSITLSSFERHSPDVGLTGFRNVFTYGSLLSPATSNFFRIFPSRLVKEPDLVYYLRIAGRSWQIHAFLKVKLKQPRPELEFASLYPFPTTISVRPRASIITITIPHIFSYPSSLY